MPIVSVSRWNLDPQTAQQLIREAAPLLKQHGAQRITLGRITTGSNSGQTTVAVQYESFETFGRALEQAKNDQKYQQIYEQAQRGGQSQSGSQSQSQQGHRVSALQDRTIVAIEEIQ